MFGIFKRDALMLEIDPDAVIAYRVIWHRADFYLLSPHMNKLCPKTVTKVHGLFLAGDYVEQFFSTTMEGAIIIRNNAAREVKRAERSG